MKATFFLCGFWVEKYPDKVKAISEDGHSIGNHSATHPHMSGMSKDGIRKELADFEKLLLPITGRRTVLFRAPYGEYDDNTILTARDSGYEVIQWNLDTADAGGMTFHGRGLCPLNRSFKVSHINSQAC